MHETSVAEKIVTTAIEIAQSNHATQILSLHLRLGELAGIEEKTLRFALEVACNGTMAQGCRVDIERVPGRFRCWTCSQERGGDLYDLCPACGNLGGDILAGREFRIVAIDVDSKDVGNQTEKETS